MTAKAGDEELVAQQLGAYDHNSTKYAATLEVVEKELRARISADVRIRLHAIQIRQKDRQSLEKKLRLAPTREIEDALGVRVITYFRDDAVWVEQIIRDMMLIREGTYTNKANSLDDREFGYRSIQFVATVPPSGFGTKRNDNIANMITPPPLSPSIVEFQIRSILEHAWAEAEHDIYKANGIVPRSVRRRFALTAALIENADEQLESLRDEFVLDQARPNENNDSPQSDGTLGDSLQQIVENNRASIALDDRIAAALDLPKRRPEKYLREVTRAIGIAGLTSAASVRRALEDWPDLGLRMAIVCVDVERPLLLPDSHYDETREFPEAFPGIGLYWLALGLTHLHQDPIASFNSVSPARLAQYREVGRVLVENPQVSALSVRERFREILRPGENNRFRTDD